MRSAVSATRSTGELQQRIKDMKKLLSRPPSTRSRGRSQRVCRLSRSRADRLPHRLSGNGLRASTRTVLSRDRLRRGRAVVVSMGRTGYASARRFGAQPAPANREFVEFRRRLPTDVPHRPQLVRCVAGGIGQQSERRHGFSRCSLPPPVSGSSGSAF
jgi:hypothetical protein